MSMILQNLNSVIKSFANALEIALTAVFAWFVIIFVT